MKKQMIMAGTGLLLLATVSCASRKTMHADRQERVEDRVQTERHASGEHMLRVATGEELTAAGYREEVTILPVGEFRYHPDSGFRGRAGRVEVHREGLRAGVRILRDSMGEENYAERTTTDSLGITERREVLHTERVYTPWRWVGVVLALAALAGYLLRRFFR